MRVFESGKHFALWILTSLVYAVLGIRMIVRHDDFGWLLLALWAFSLTTWLIIRALKQRAKTKSATNEDAAK